MFFLSSRFLTMTAYGAVGTIDPLIVVRLDTLRLLILFLFFGEVQIFYGRDLITTPWLSILKLFIQ